MKKRQRIVVAMSGGVDSSTVAGLLVEAGHEVIGVAMKTHRGEVRGARACCTPDDMRDARRVADLLQIPFYILNYADIFAAEVIAPFAAAYRAGRTPNPCVDCNAQVKFKPLLQRARQLQADALATGHYARILQVEARTGTRRYLQRGVDGQKDQSYFLYRLEGEVLAQLRFPLGDMCKAEVRDHARRLGLPVADKVESQEICFVGAEGYAQTVEKVLPQPAASGDVVDAHGEVLGAHAGIHRYTVGQRRGLGLSHAEPLYVTALDAERNEVQVGPRSALLTASIDLENVQWTGDAPPLPAVAAAAPPVLLAQRYRDVTTPARLELLAQTSSGLRLRAHFLQPQPRGAPGQAAVIYGSADPARPATALARAEQVVLGGGTLLASPRQRALRVLPADAARAP